MSEGPYRAMPDVLGAAERLNEACVQLGKWRDGLRTRVLLLFALVGVTLAPLGYLSVQDFQAEQMEGRAWIYVNVLGCAAPFVALLFLGRTVARALLRRRTPAQIAHLAAAYDIAPAELDEIARLSDL